MNRVDYFNYIEEKINLLALRINSRGKLNILDFHAHSENFYQHLFNNLFNWELVNLNENKQNVEAIDLIDHSNKYIIQVSAANTKEKVESALRKNIIKDHLEYRFKFISISRDADDLRKKEFNNPHNITFDPICDIYDVNSILKYIKGLEISNQKKIFQLIKDELGKDIDIIRLDSNLATIIDVLSKEDWDENNQAVTVDSFEIERKISFNKLSFAKHIIEDYGVHYARVDKKYTEFDAMGVNKSNSVLAAIRKEYIKNSNIKSDDELFFTIIDNVQEKIINSANFVQIPADELELCINIIVVDAFIRCKIFKNPKYYDYAIT